MLLFVQSWMLFKLLQAQSVAKTSQTKLPWAYLRILPRINRKWSGNKNFWSSILLPHSHALLRRKHNGRIKTHQVTFSACKTDCACKQKNQDRLCLQELKQHSWLNKKQHFGIVKRIVFCVAKCILSWDSFGKHSFDPHLFEFGVFSKAGNSNP